MKIRQLHINRFGHFNERDLVFEGDGLQCVYGPNEAGKTTLLEFLRGLLFDFPVRTNYDFGGPGDMSGVATLELRDGRLVELRRRKGNKDKVAIKIDGQPTNLDDAGWLRLLDHADRGLFESVFAFGLDQLSRGEESLKHESLQSALFGGSLGGAGSPDKILADLDQQAAALFKSGRASNPSINKLLAEMKLLTKSIHENQLRPDKFHDAEAAVERCSEHAKSLHDQVEKLRREHSRIERQARAWPKWNDLKLRREERAGLSLPQNIPADARQRFQVLSRDLKSVEDELQRCHAQIDKAEHDLQSLHLDPGAVSFRAEIKTCLEQRKSYCDAKRDQPKVEQELEVTRQQVDRELADLRPDWTYQDLSAFTLDAATRAEIDRLNDAHLERVKQRTRIEVRRESNETAIDQARTDLATLGEEREVTELAAVLADEQTYLADGRQREEIRDELAKLERRLTAQVRRLSPPLPAGVESIHTLPVPRIESVTQFDSQFDELREQHRIARSSLDDEEAERNEINRRLSSAVSSRIVPSLDERDDARNRRDAGWNLIQRTYIAGEQTDADIERWLSDPTNKSLPAAYEQSVRDADRIADTIYDNANEVAERENLRRQLAESEQRIEQKRKRLEELATQQAGCETEWRQLWQPCGFEPLAPQAMLSWIKDWDAVCATIAQRDELHESEKRLSERTLSFEQRLHAALPPSNARDIAVMLAAARQSVDAAKEQHRRRTELASSIKRLERDIARDAKDLLELTQAHDAAKSEWQVILKRLQFPADWDLKLAREVSDRLLATRRSLDELDRMKKRIAQMQSTIDDFESRVQSLCHALDEKLLRDPPELSIEKLSEQLERAIDAQRRHDELTQQLSTAQKEQQVLDERLKKLISARDGLFAAASATTEQQFLEVVSRAERVARLDNEIETLQRELDSIRANDERAEFEQSLSSNEQSVLQGQERDLRDKLKVAEEARRIADGDEAVARKALAALDGSDVAARLSEEQSRKRALLVDEIDRYMPLIYAKHLLTNAVARFERENQPAMIATVSQLLGKMTEGRYVEFDRTGAGKHGMVIRRDDGSERTPDQLSTGTREQLYLAIRLAYVLHYCEKNQPLPIVFDDVLVNFDEARCRQTLKVLAELSQSAQVLFFTCHPHMVRLVREIDPSAKPIELG